ncbi:MAG: carboxyl-terminal processing protease [Caulobacter sp.]|nr:carboxyl-terminal processing protease [Caulobacter sp.]
MRALATLLALMLICTGLAGAVEARAGAGANEGLRIAQAFEPLFAAEFADPEPARQAWETRGAVALEVASGGIYPRLDPKTFNAAGLAALRAERARNPAATVEDLIDAVLAAEGRHLRLIRPESNTWPESRPRWDDPRPGLDATLTLDSDGPAVLRIPTFKTDASRDAYDAIALAIADRTLPDRLIIDLRGNDGGLVFNAASAAFLFLPGGKTFAIGTRTREGMERDHVDKAHRPLLPPGTQVIVLIGAETNGAALAFAMALADNGRARIAGVAAAEVRGGVTTAFYLDLTPIPAAPQEKWLLINQTGILIRPNGQPLGAGVRVDIPIDAKGDEGLKAAGRAFGAPLTPSASARYPDTCGCPGHRAGAAAASGPGPSSPGCRSTSCG